MQSSVQHHLTSASNAVRTSHLWRPVILAGGFLPQEEETLVLWFSDLAEHPSDPVLVIVNDHAKLPDVVGTLGLVSSVRASPPSTFVRWADHADIFSMGAAPLPSDYLPPCPTVAMGNGGRARLPRLGVNGFFVQDAEEWRAAIRALLDDPALCFAMSTRNEIPNAKRI